MASMNLATMLESPIGPNNDGTEKPAAVFKIERDFHQKTQMIGNAKRTERRKGMTVMQMKMNGFADGTESLNHIENCRQGRSNRFFHVWHDLRKFEPARLKRTDVLTGMNF